MLIQNHGSDFNQLLTQNFNELECLSQASLNVIGVFLVICNEITLRRKVRKLFHLTLKFYKVLEFRLQQKFRLSFFPVMVLPEKSLRINFLLQEVDHSIPPLHFKWEDEHCTYNLYSL